MGLSTCFDKRYVFDTYYFVLHYLRCKQQAYWLDRWQNFPKLGSVQKRSHCFQSFLTLYAMVWMVLLASHTPVCLLYLQIFQIRYKSICLCTNQHSSYAYTLPWRLWRITRFTWIFSQAFGRAVWVKTSTTVMQRYLSMHLQNVLSTWQRPSGIYRVHAGYKDCSARLNCVSVNVLRMMKRLKKFALIWFKKSLGKLLSHITPLQR